MGVSAREPRRAQAREPTLQVRLLGGVELRLDEAPLPPLESARAESLLAYLLLHRDAPQARQRLAFLLWPDSTESQARTNLRHVLHRLRRSLPDADRFIDAGPRTLRWRAEAPLRLDVAVFEDAISAGRLEEAVEAYGGELLEGCYDDWLLEERERLAQLHLDALEQLARRLEDEGRLADAIRCSERLLRHDPLREETYRLLMRLHGSAGDRARALRVYHVCAATLQRELGIEPATATREAYEALLPAAGEVPAGGGAASAGPPLVGRSQERARLAACWRDAEAGAARLVVVSGEPGVGKTRLVEELRSWCAHRGAATAEARAYPAEGAMAYGPVVAWLRSEALARRVRRLDPRQRTELGRLLPELLEEDPGLTPPQPLPEEEQRQRLFDAVTQAVFAGGGALLLVADDLQWWDPQTLQLVHYLLRTRPDARLLVAATARRQEIDAGHPADELVAGLQALGRADELLLGRLTRDETATLAAHVAGRGLDDAQADRLFGESEGNPLFVVEAMRAGPGGAAAGMTAKVQAVIGARLAQLSEPAAELVGVAATIGREFTAQVLADAAECDEQTFVRALDELWRRGLVRAHGPNAYDFSHGKIRDAAYRALSPARVRHNHLRVAWALERGDDPDAVSGQVAAHYESAGQQRAAVEWHLRAADAALRLYANAAAAHALERALELTRRLPPGDARDHLELTVLTALPGALVFEGGYLFPRIAEVHERALALTAQLGVEPEPPLLWSLALARLTRGEFAGAQSLGQALRRRAERADDDVLRVQAAYVSGVADFWRGRLESARAHFAEALRHYRPAQSAAHLMRYVMDPQMFCQMRLAYTLWLLGRDDDAGRAFSAVLELLERSRHRYSTTATHLWAAWLALDRHDPDTIRRMLEAVRSEGIGEWQVDLTLGAMGGYLDVLDGRAGEGLERIRRTVAEWSPRPAAPGAPGMLARVLVEACVAGGEPEAAVTAVDEALEMGRGAELWAAELRRLRARARALLGAAPDDVEGDLREAIEIARVQGARAFERRARDDLRRLAGQTP